MTHIAELFEGASLVRLLPGGPVSVLRTPRLLPPRLVELDPAPVSAVAVDDWTWTGEAAEGEMTAELWIRTFGAELPRDSVDRRTMLVSVVWLRYLHTASS